MNLPLTNNPPLVNSTAEPLSSIVGIALLLIFNGYFSSSATHLPALVIPIKMGSKDFLSNPPRTPPAETHETSCSLLGPPQIIAIFNLLI